MSTVTWVVESEVFPNSHAALRRAVTDFGYRLVDWNDEWWSEGFPSNVGGMTTVFHGSLGNAARIAEELDWSPGSYCNTSAFCCSTWYGDARKGLLNAEWRILPANQFVQRASEIAAELGCTHQVFVRPDSPLKPFSGRVLDVDRVSLTALDYGFYFEDESLPIVAARVRAIEREWRFVVSRSTVIAGCEYDSATRSAVVGVPDSNSREFAQSVATEMPGPAEVYVLDICESDGELRLLELNPFGGADLYACDARKVVEGVSGQQG